jgi:hypothetical protein
MAITPLSLRSDYWSTYNIQEHDLEYLYNFLLEHETPQTSQELVASLINERIRQEKANLTNRQLSEGTIFLPKNHYKVGETLSFPALDWKQGKVESIRPGYHPEYPTFEVIKVKFANSEEHEFASGVDNHPLNEPVMIKIDDPQLDPAYVFKKYGPAITLELTEMLEANPDLVRIAGRWFPRALLVDVNIGHLNLAEAVLDMAGGGAMRTHELLEQIELPTDVNSKLTEFSLNLALQEDGRFDEVGPAGEILWYLRRLEPEGVQTPPLFLKYNFSNYDPDVIQDLLPQIDRTTIDELEPFDPEYDEDDLTITLIYPHWRAGTLPLTKRVSRFFPTAYESPRVQFTFVDGDTGQKFSGWVVRSGRYIFGLQDWYTAQNMIPGGFIHVKRSKNPGEVIIRADKHRPSREWIRTALVGADGGIVFAMLKQVISCSFDERMAVVISDLATLDQTWISGSRKQNMEQTILGMMRELSKLNPQSHVHFQELYASVNLVRRCPPGVVLSHLVSHSWARHLGDLYFKLEENLKEGTLNE